MWQDPIVEEIHRVREDIWRECGEDLDQYFERLKKRDEERGPMSPPVEGDRRGGVASRPAPS